MNTEKGIWKVSTGKGNRIYINCTDERKIMHPQQLCENNGLGIYGYEHLKDLAIAILLFEKEKQNKESIMYDVDNETSTSKNIMFIDELIKYWYDKQYLILDEHSKGNANNEVVHLASVSNILDIIEQLKQIKIVLKENK